MAITLPLVGSMTTADAGRRLGRRGRCPGRLPCGSASCWASASSAERCTSMSMVSTHVVAGLGRPARSTVRIGLPSASTSMVLMPGRAAQVVLVGLLDAGLADLAVGLVRLGDVLRESRRPAWRRSRPG